MNVNKELFLIIGEIKKAKSFKNVFWKQKRNGKEKERYLVLDFLFYLFIMYSVGFTFLNTYMKYARFLNMIT
ncbi:hypothetical protein BV582_09310 [Bacillus paralicheniformis]|uniref:hypothetical protein n=1 Tax=Bacillus paralicheniformis TaxID=1648923 RepID=UPI000C78D53F|nr:hypothetical protein [Bacillus paralicheniformis]PLC17687.1 hypothetical protein BV582_09310 [Bacillus paralicheniformis]